MLNSKKTKYMIFRTRNKLSKLASFNLQMGGEILEKVSAFKYLGVLLDETLFFVPVVPVGGRYTRACDTVMLRIPRMCTNLGQKAIR